MWHYYNNVWITQWNTQNTIQWEGRYYEYLNDFNHHPHLLWDSKETCWMGCNLYYYDLFTFWEIKEKLYLLCEKWLTWKQRCVKETNHQNGHWNVLIIAELVTKSYTTRRNLKI